jgi:hypothetical protein
MRPALTLLLLCPTLWAAPITPTIDQTVIEIGNTGLTDVSGTYTFTGYDFNATITGNASTFPGPPDGGGQAVADITLEAEFLVAGTGIGYLHYGSTGESDGSGGQFDSSYQLNDLNESCLFDCSDSGLDQIELGQPFFLSETGIASAYSGNYPEDGGYQVYVNFTASDEYGNPLPFTEIALPTPEPESFALLGLGLILTAGILRSRGARPA